MSLSGPSLPSVMALRNDARGLLLPGLPNVHSHAFQRAMAGLAEQRIGRHDSFWSWRETMYRFAGRIQPEDLHAIATQLYVEMLEAGYTRVCEFHYLHHAPDGRPYAEPAAMSQALIEAAKETGIRLVLLPVLYMTGGFDGRALSARQQRFGHDVDTYLRLVETLTAHESSMLRVGIALHSLRAVPPDAMRHVLATPLARQRPIHIHIAEQVAEVEECLAQREARPVAWLLDHAEVDARWCLVHATHLDADECTRLARSGAVVGLCPTTEANLGDGLFPFRNYLEADGRFGIGSDSHSSVSPVEELRWLEYGQRLILRARTIAASAECPHAGSALYEAALRGGLQACGGPFADESKALHARDDFDGDAVVLDAESPILAGRSGATALDSWIFSGNVPIVRDVRVGGDWIVRDGRHPQRERIAERYRTTLRRLLVD